MPRFEVYGEVVIGIKVWVDAEDQFDALIKAGEKVGEEGFFRAAEELLDLKKSPDFQQAKEFWE